MMNLIQKIFKLLDSQNFRITFYPAENNNWMMQCNGYFIGGIFNEQLCFIYSESSSDFLNNPTPVFYGYSKDATHKMLVCPLDQAESVLRKTYQEQYGSKRFICDISQHFKSNYRYPDKIIRDYELFKIFLQFSYEHGLLKHNPLDAKDRILFMNYVESDLSEKGILIFEKLLMIWLNYTDRTNKIDNIKMLKKYYTQMVNEVKSDI